MKTQSEPKVQQVVGHEGERGELTTRREVAAGTHGRGLKVKTKLRAGDTFPGVEYDYSPN